jgi:hypothetical protein
MVCLVMDRVNQAPVGSLMAGVVGVGVERLDDAAKHNGVAARKAMLRCGLEGREPAVTVPWLRLF